MRKLKYILRNIVWFLSIKKYLSLIFLIFCGNLFLVADAVIVST